MTHMRKEMSERIGWFHEFAKQEKSEKDPAELQSIQDDLDWHIREAAIVLGTSPDTQKLVYEMQKKKGDIMDNLKEELRAIDTGQDIAVDRDSRPLVYDEKRDALLYRKDSENFQSLSLGDLLTDGDWGITYHLDVSVPRHIRKRYAVTEAKRKLYAYLDDHVRISEGQANSGVQPKNHAYAKAARDYAVTEDEMAQKTMGYLAEKISKNFLQKICIDAHLDFLVEDTDFYQDMEQKIDFVIQRKYGRIDQTTEKHKKERVGIQLFVVSGYKQVWRKRQKEHKQKQIDRAKERFQHSHEMDVDDIFPVPIEKSSGIKEAMKRAYTEWSTHQTCGGPDRMLSMDIKKVLFREILRNVFSPRERREQWRKVVASEEKRRMPDDGQSVMKE